MMDRPRDGLGASDAAAVLGVSRWHTPLDVWNDKMGINPEAEREEHQQWGILLEPAIAARYTQETGRRLRRVGTLRSREHPILYAHPDRLVVGERGLVEIKVSSRSWRDAIPIYYKTQAIQQMLVADREWVDFAVLERGQRFAQYRLDRDRSLEPDFVAELEDWWERHIVGKEPPDMDGGDAGRRYLRATHPEGDGAEVVATAEMLPLIDQYRMTRQNREQAEAAEEALKQEVQRLIGDASAMIGPFGRIMWTRYTAHKTNWQAVAKVYRQILERTDPPIAVLAALAISEWPAGLDTYVDIHTNKIATSKFTTTWNKEEE